MTRLEAIQAACRITDACLAHLLTLPKNLTEKQLAYQAKTFFRRHGTAPAFPPIIAVNSHAATPHHKPTHRQIKSGNLLLIDIGCRYRGYCSDLTRTVFLGTPTPLQQKVYRLVKQAYHAALSILVASRYTLTTDVDSAARQVIASAGYGKYFIHGTGHGVGRRIHQLPKIGPRATRYKLRAGMVITIEPGIYLPRRFGIRLEDTLLLAPIGPRPLTHSPFLPL